MKIRLLFFVMMIVVGGAFAQRSYHFDVDGTGTRAEGTGWDDAIGVTDTIKHIIENDLAAGDSLFFKPGTYTFTANLGNTTQDGTATAPILFYGVKDATTNTAGNIVRSDLVGHWAADSANFPLIELGAYYYRLSAVMIFEGFRFNSTSNSACVWGDAGNVLKNCVVNLTSTSVAASAVYTVNTVLDCHVMTTGARGFREAFEIISTKIVGGNRGASSVTSGRMSGCLLVEIDTAVSVATNLYAVLNCTFYKNDIDVYSVNSDRFTAIRNLHDSSRVAGYYWGTQTDCNVLWGNHGSDGRCVDMFYNVADAGLKADPYLTSGDPKFKNVTDTLFLQYDSPARDSTWSGIGLRP